MQKITCFPMEQVEEFIYSTRKDCSVVLGPQYAANIAYEAKGDCGVYLKEGEVEDFVKTTIKKD